MDHISDILVADLRHHVRALGANGGLIGPSVYDTAQVLRLAPPAEGVWPALNWLVSQQHPDGGWGQPTVPRARDVPTLAAVLALHTYDQRGASRAAVRAGVQFLKRQALVWSEPLPEDLPVGVELLLPRLLEQAAQAGLDLPHTQYRAIVGLGERRRQMIAALPQRPGTTPLHSWEAWGVDPRPDLLDGSGGVGHSPAATAAWVRAAGDRPDLADAQAAARRYLQQAAQATGENIPGVVPTVWPITRFEQSNALYALLLGGHLQHPALAEALAPQLADLAAAMRPSGLGMSDWFVVDGDDTAEALAVLHAVGRAANGAALRHFANNDHFVAYPGELQPSLSVTAHAAHTLRRVEDTPCAEAFAFVVERQLPDGRWPGDKWNGSWLYTTGHAVAALRDTAHDNALDRAIDALLAHQWPDGGWGVNQATAEETAYAVLALRSLPQGSATAERAQAGRERAEHWLLDQYRPFRPETYTCWLGKELYRPLRLARVIELAATLPQHHA